MNNPVGAPRTVSPLPSEMIILGEEMVKWVKENNPIHLSQWYSFQKKFTKAQWRAMKLLPEFLPYYEEALQSVGLNYIKKNSEVEPSIKQRWQRVYFEDLRECEDEDLNEDAERKKKIAAVQHETQVNLNVPAGLAIGSNLPTPIISNPNNQGSE